MSNLSHRRSAEGHDHGRRQSPDRDAVRVRAQPAPSSTHHDPSSFAWQPDPPRRGSSTTGSLIRLRAAVGNRDVRVRIGPSDILISSYSSGGPAGDDPMDELSISFAKIEFEYFLHDHTGQTGSVRAGYDLKARKAV